jgi:hypothetical protein
MQKVLEESKEVKWLDVEVQSEVIKYDWENKW